MFAFARRRGDLPAAVSRLATLSIASAALGAVLVVLFGGAAQSATPPKSITVNGTAANKWDPSSTNVAVGGTVTFKVVAGGPHPVGAGPVSAAPNGDNSFVPGKCGDFATMVNGGTCTITFKKAGTYQYFCKSHYSLGMVGTIVVGSGGTTTATTTGAATASTAPVVSTPTQAAPPTPGKPGIYWAGYGLLALGALLALIAVVAYLRFAPGFRRQRR
ncbi:MAG TPA: plastocyanin/azurin family copper-binding protein [Actinomycetota bacterium]